MRTDSSLSSRLVDGATPRKTYRRFARRGQTLVLFAMLTFALLALAALIVDVGYARLARLQMQSATDASALEMLRFRDDFPLEWLDGDDIDPTLKTELENLPVDRPTTTQTATDPDWIAWRDEVRRVMARRLTRNVFDDDLQSDSIANNFGAGPIIGLDGGVGDPELHAGQEISLADEPVYKPELQLNSANEEHGDMVSGRYAAAPATTAPAPNDYARDDFTPSGGNYDNAALVRLRRSNETYGITGDGIASNGPALPYLFARGSLLNRKAIGNGIFVRATSIAAAGSDTGGPMSYGRVMSAGPAIPSSNVRGLTPFAVSASYWQASFWNDTSNSPGTDSLSLSAGGDSIESTKFGSQAGVTGGTPTAILSVGDTYVPIANANALSSQTSTLNSFVPIYDAVGSNSYVIIGFGFAQWDSSTSTLTRPFDDGGLIEVVVQGSASASPAGSAFLNAAVLNAHRALLQPAFSPVLVNAQ